MQYRKLLAALMTLLPIAVVLLVSQSLPLPQDLGQHISVSASIAQADHTNPGFAAPDESLPTLGDIKSLESWSAPPEFGGADDEGLLLIDSLTVPDAAVSIPNCPDSLQISSVPKSLTHREALQALKEWRSVKAPKPVIVGGLGDSGTRGVYELLNEFDVYMGRGRAINTYTKDSKIFVTRMNLSLDDGSLSDFGLSGFVNPMLKAAGSLFYCKEALKDDERWYNGMRYFVHKIQAVYLHAKRYAPKAFRRKSRTLFYGFKHPRSLLVLPWLKAALDNRFKFIFVVRDGREVATGNNKRFYHDICPLYYHQQNRRCWASPAHRLKFWAAINMEAIEWMKKHGGSKQFLIVRAEDLVNGKPECLQRVAAFVGVSEAKQLRSAVVARKFTTFSSSYNGNKLSFDVKVKLGKLLEKYPDVRAALSRLGYQTNASMGVLSGCADLDIDRI